MDDSFYVVVDNKDSLASNKLNCQLYSKISLPENKYEVSLTDIEYQLGNFRNFAALKSDGEVTCWIGLEEIEHKLISKSTDDFKIWLLSVYPTLAEKDVKLNFRVGNQENMYIKNESDRNFIMPPDLAKALGFKNTEFEPGEHTAENNIIHSDFARLPSDKNVKFSFVKRKEVMQFNFLKTQIAPITKFSDLTSHLTAAFLDVPVAFETDEKEKTFTIKPEDQTKYKIQFSHSFNRMLKLPLDYIFENISYILPLPSITLKHEQINVFMNGVRPTMISSSVEPILKTFYPPDLVPYKDTRISFTPRNYVSLDKNEFQFIKLFILNEYREDVSFAFKQLSCTLHFRPKTYEKSSLQ